MQYTLVPHFEHEQLVMNSKLIINSNIMECNVSIEHNMKHDNMISLLAINFFL